MLKGGRQWHQADIAVADGLMGTIRAGQWWDHKLVPIFAAFYATAVMSGVPIASLWRELALLLLAMIAGAAFVSLVNDLADVDDDRAASKPNRMAGRSRAFRAAALALPLGVGALLLWLWRDDLALAAAFAAAWIAFALYSLPPVRLKGRGLAGILADASGAHLFPTLVAVLLAFRAAAAPVDPWWTAALAAWAIGYGLRGILGHQIADRPADRAAGVATFAARRPLAAARLAAAAFALELAGLGALLATVGTILPLLLLGLYLAMAALRVRLWGMKAVLAAPAPRYFLVMHDYYDALLPLALLAASALLHPLDWTVLAVHLLLFHRRPLATLLIGLSLLATLARRWAQSR